MRGVALHGDKEWEKFNDARLAHWERVANWRPRCHCIRYCNTIVEIDRDGDPIARWGMKDRTYKPRLKAQGLTRPYHCNQQASSRPGYRKRGLFIISFILKFALHRAKLARSVLKRG